MTAMQMRLQTVRILRWAIAITGVAVAVGTAAVALDVLGHQSWAAVIPPLTGILLGGLGLVTNTLLMRQAQAQLAEAGTDDEGGEQ